MSQRTFLSVSALALGLFAGLTVVPAGPAEAARSVVYTATYTTFQQCATNLAREPSLGGVPITGCYAVKVSGSGSSWWRYQYVLR